MAYRARWVELENKVIALRIDGVVMAMFVTADERGADLNDEWWGKAVKTAADRESKGKRAGLVFKRNVFTHTDPLVAGYFTNLRWDRPDAKADLVITDPEEALAVIRGERTQLSIEAQVDRHLVWGVELIQGSEGHFSEDIPELRVENVSIEDPECKQMVGAAGATRLRAPDEDLVALAAQPRKETEMKLSTEDRAALVKDLQPEITNAVRAALATALPEVTKGITAELAKGKAEPAKKDPPAPDVVKLAAELEAEKVRGVELETRLAAHERREEIEGYVRKLRAKNCPMDDEKIREQFAKLSTKEGREQCLARLESFKLATDDAPLDDDLKRPGGKAGAAKLKAQLEADFDRNADLWKQNGVTKEEYVARHMKNHAE